MRAILGFAFAIGFVSNVCALDTTIKGDTMELKNQGQVILFKGGVRLERGNDILKANQMETTKRRDRITANGDVRLVREMSQTEKLKGFGKRGFYDTQTGEGYLMGGAVQSHIIYTEVLSATSTRTIDIYADRFDFMQVSTQAVATGTVYGKSIDPNTNDIVEFWSEAANYDGVAKKLVLTGEKKQPKARQTSREDNRIILGDIVTYYFDAKSFSSDGKAQAFFLDAPPYQQQ